MFKLILPLHVVIAYPAVTNRPKLLCHSNIATCMDEIVDICCLLPHSNYCKQLVAQPQFNDILLNTDCGVMISQMHQHFQFIQTTYPYHS